MALGSIAPNARASRDDRRANPEAPAPRSLFPAAALGRGPSNVVGYFAGATSTATKTNTPIMDIPQSITILTKQQLQDRNSIDLNRALMYVPGVTVAQGEGNRDQITIRGQDTTADFFTDGVRDDAQYYRDLYNIEAVEVLKGPSALIFGRGGGGGVINRVTKKADGEPFARCRSVRAVSLASADGRCGRRDHRHARLPTSTGFMSSHTATATSSSSSATASIRR